MASLPTAGPTEGLWRGQRTRTVAWSARAGGPSLAAVRRVSRGLLGAFLRRLRLLLPGQAARRRRRLHGDLTLLHHVHDLRGAVADDLAGGARPLAGPQPVAPVSLACPAVASACPPRRPGPTPRPAGLPRPRRPSWASQQPAAPGPATGAGGRRRSRRPTPGTAQSPSPTWGFDPRPPAWLPRHGGYQPCRRVAVALTPPPTATPAADPGNSLRPLSCGPRPTPDPLRTVQRTRKSKQNVAERLFSA